MTPYEIDPLKDPRWARFLLKQPGASVFHSEGWLRALRNAYGFEPVAFTTTPPQCELENGIVFCHVRSRLTGNRLVSLPFSDHCEPLLDSQSQLDCLLSWLNEEYGRKTKCVEIRPLTSRFASRAGLKQLEEFRLHRITLASSADAMFREFHKNIQRNIRRAESRLRCEAGTSEKLLDHLRTLLTLTRRRHLLPPQPLIWFRSLLDCLGSRITIRIAYKEETPVAGILTLRHNRVMVYKYGGYDTRYRDCGGMAFLLWRTIQEACHEGILEFDLGRSESQNAGLIRFKEGWSATGSTLTYWNYGDRRFDGATSRVLSRCAQQVFPLLPNRLIAIAGSLLYRHVG